MSTCTIWFALTSGAKPVSVTLPGVVSAALFWDKLRQGDFHMTSQRPASYASVAEWSPADEVVTVNF